MIVVTVAQDQAVRDHLNWCVEQIEENERSIVLFREGTMHIGEGGRDVTAEWVARLEKQTKELRRIVEALAPAEFSGIRNHMRRPGER